MGNCIVVQEKVVKIMKTDGKILEYKAPLKVHQVLSEFAGHAISDSLSVIQHLLPDANMLGGRLYYLLPLPVPSPKSSKKKVKFADDQVDLEANHKPEVVRIKIVITKKELQALLSSTEGGIFTVDDIAHPLHNMEKKIEEINSSHADDDTVNGKRWKPLLDSIPEFMN